MSKESSSKTTVVQKFSCDGWGREVTQSEVSFASYEKAKDYYDKQPHSKGFPYNGTKLVHKIEMSK